MSESAAGRTVPVFPLSNTTGEGVDALQAHLHGLRDKEAAEHEQACFRLAIDRAFHLKGSGLVVTGTASAGNVAVGDTLRLEPGGREVRVRSLRVHDGEAQVATVGQRCALNLAGDIALEDVSRGDWLVGLDAAPPSSCIDVSCALLPTAPFGIKHMSPVKLHIGARRVSARLALLGDARLNAGEEVLCQLLTEAPLACARHERFLLRDDSGSVLLGGGTVIDPQGQKPGRNKSQYLAQVRAMQTGNVAWALSARLELDEPVDTLRFAGSCNLTSAASESLATIAPRTYIQDGTSWMISENRWRNVRASLQQGIDAHHRENPKEAGLKVSSLTAPLRKTAPQHLLLAVLGDMIRGGSIILKDGLVSSAEFRPRVSSRDEKTWQKIRQVLDRRGQQIPLLSELIESTGLEETQLKKIIREKLKAGELHRVSERRSALPQHLLGLAQGLRKVAARGENITVINVKNEWSAGRNLTVEVLEYFDSIRFTQRRDNERVVLDEELPERLYSG